MSLTKATYSMIDGAPANVLDFGAVGDGVTDDTAALQAAFDYAGTNNCGVYVPKGTYMVSTTLKIGTSTRLFGDSMINSIIKMKAQPTGTKPTYTGSTAYPPTLDYFPVIWNASPIQWFSIRDLCIDGGGFDVYGLRLQENYYGEFRNVVIMNCNKYPYINVRGQNLSHVNFVCYQNLAGTLLFNNTGVSFTDCGWERLGTDTALEIRAPVSTKSGVTLSTCWFEDDVAPWNTTGTWIKICGRNPVIETCYFSHTGTPIEGIRCIGAADLLTFDNISTPNDAGAINGKFSVNFAANTDGVIFSADSYGNDLTGLYTSSSVIDNNGNNTWAYTLTPNGTIKESGNAGWEWRINGSSFVKMDPANNRLQLFGANNFLGSSSGILELKGALGAYTRTGTSIELLTKVGSNLYISDTLGSSNATSGGIYLGGMHIFRGTAAPTTGTHAVGDMCINQTPAVGQPKGWRCTVAGTPGTWVSEGNL